MAIKRKISELVLATNVNNSDSFPITRGNILARGTIAQLAAVLSADIATVTAVDALAARITTLET